MSVFVLFVVSCNLFLSCVSHVSCNLCKSANHLPPPTPYSFFLFQFLILPKLSFSRGNRLHVSIVPLNTPKPINIIQDKVSTTANAIQYVFTEYVIPRSADTYSVRKVRGRNRMVALLMSSATLVRRSTPADCDMATSWKFCLNTSVRDEFRVTSSHSPFAPVHLSDAGNPCIRPEHTTKSYLGVVRTGQWLHL
jgi:hypothetical protein